MGKKRVFSEIELREELQESRKRLKSLEEQTEKVRMIVAKGFEKETLAKMISEYNQNKESIIPVVEECLEKESEDQEVEEVEEKEVESVENVVDEPDKFKDQEMTQII